MHCILRSLAVLILQYPKLYPVFPKSGHLHVDRKQHAFGLEMPPPIFVYSGATFLSTKLSSEAKKSIKLCSYSIPKTSPLFRFSKAVQSIDWKILRL
ncbi:hypothetical protein L1887_31030 [Cichorium endivia]|nr:hypothetical protein L1887_31030 [Cichorium endivia]